MLALAVLAAVARGICSVEVKQTTPINVQTQPAQLCGDEGACRQDKSAAAEGLGVNLLQAGYRLSDREKAALGAEAGRRDRDLVLMHIPYNFGHTVEGVAMFGSGLLNTASGLGYGFFVGGYSGLVRQADWSVVKMIARPGGEIWGHANPDLQVTSELTGCPLYYTPQKYWPEHIAANYFGNKTIFGLLRDPYERLVAFFRGSIPGYGGGYSEFLESCDVNGAVKKMMLDYLNGTNNFSEQCTFLPQAEFFDGPYGITLPVNNRLFPESMNKVFLEHGYGDFVIQRQDVLHVRKCPDVWAADLDAETRAMVKQVYARDFELLCKHFGYCDREENCCIYQVPAMCPAKLIKAGYEGRPLNRSA